MSEAQPVLRVAAISYHTCPLEPPGTGDSGGLNVFVLSLAQALARRGARVDIYTRKSVSEAAHVVIAGPGVRVIHVEAGPPRSLSKIELASYRWEFAEGVARYAERCFLPYDVVHSHYWMSGPAALRLALPSGAAHFHTFHTLQVAKEMAGASSGSALALERRKLEAELVTRADLLTASTRYEADILKDAYGASEAKIAILPPGYDPAVFDPHGSGRRSSFSTTSPALDRLLNTSSPLVVAAGRIQPLKGFELAVEAVDRMRSLYPYLANTGFVICGGPSGEDGDKELQRLQAAISSTRDPSRTLLAGPVGRRELADILRRADTLLVTSKTESFGMIALEALACGTPVVATDSGGVSEIVDNGVTGVVISSREPEALARALGELLSSPQRLRKMGREAARSVGHLTWDRVAEAFLNTYLEISDSASAGGLL